MPGWLAVAKIGTIRRINAILRDNIAELAALIERVQDPAIHLPLLDISHPERNDAFLGECERLLHNALSAVHSRVELLRAFVDRYVVESTPSIAAEYHDRKDADFANDQTHIFLTKLRNYMLHGTLPVLATQFNYTRDSGTSYAVLLRTDRMASDRYFNATTKRWLADQGGSLDVVAVLRGYYERVGRFDGWFTDRIKEHHREEIDAYVQAARAYDACVDAVFR